MQPGTEVAGEECVGEGQPGDSGQQGEGGIDHPDDAERLHLAGVVLQFELQAGHGGTGIAAGRPHCGQNPCPGGMPDHIRCKT